MHPSSLPPGSLIGSWRLRSLASQGSQGVVFRAERLGYPEAGSFAPRFPELVPGEPPVRRGALPSTG